MTQFLRDEGSDSEEVLTPLMLDGTYLSRNFATLGPFLTLQPPCLAPSIGSQVRSFSCRSLPYHSPLGRYAIAFPFSPLLSRSRSAPTGRGKEVGKWVGWREGHGNRGWARLHVGFFVVRGPASVHPLLTSLACRLSSFTSKLNRREAGGLRP